MISTIKNTQVSNGWSTWNGFDYLRIYNGNSYDRNHLMSQLTGTSLPSDISSLGPQMLIIFDTDFWKRERGFKANIIFEDANIGNGTETCSVANPCDINEGPCYYDGQCSGSLRCSNGNCYDYCGQFLDMENETGTFEYYFNTYYGDMQECSWSLQVEIDYIITIEFIEISVRIIFSTKVH